MRSFLAKLHKSTGWILLYLLSFGWFLWSFILTDRSLIYSSTSVFVQFQNFFWQYADARGLQSVIYVVLVVSFFVLYLRIIHSKKNMNIRRLIMPAVLFYLILALSNPALSYDLFNYMFDAKLVVHYHLDPHTTAAISFIQTDDWVRFMRNVFFPTTYGYVWTALSVIPFVLGIGKLLLTFIAFKLFMVGGLVLLFFLECFILLREQKQDKRTGINSLALFFFSPLVFLETLSSGHNDVWMMVLAFASLALLVPRNMLFSGMKKTVSKEHIISLMGRTALSFALLYASSEIKRSTVLLIPVWGILALGIWIDIFPIKEKIKTAYKKIGYWWADIGALLLFAPLVTDLSRQFHPWYLIWSLSFLPFVKNRLLRILLITFSLTSQFRYIPFLYVGVYSDSLILLQKMITWTALPLGLLVWCFVVIHERMKNKRNL